jgi:hypothetical protein
MRELRTKPAHDNEKATEGDIREWRRMAIRFLNSQLDEDGSTALKRSRLLRVASWEWLCALDHMLVTCTGKGVAQFLPAGGPEAPLPVLAVTMDQGSVGFAPMHYLMYHLKANSVIVADPNHRCWNDVKNSIKQAGLWDAVLASGVAMNVGFGPFDGQAWWHEIAEAAMQHAAVAGKSCPLLAAMLPKIAAERDEMEMLCDPGYAQYILDQIQEGRIMAVKGPKLALCRWMSWVDCYAFWRPIRSMRCLLLLYIGIQQGWVTADPSSTALCLRQKSQDAGLEDDKKTMVSKSCPPSQMVQDTRVKCHNTLHVATCVLLDEDIQRKSSIIFAVTAATRVRHSTQCKQVRSPASSLHYYTLEASGAGLQELSEILRIFVDSEVALAQAGFPFVPAEVGCRTLNCEDAVVECENAWMLVAMRFAISLARNRACSMLWNLQGFPGHLPVLMHPDPAVQKIGLQLGVGFICIVRPGVLQVWLVCLRLGLAAVA